MSRHSVSIFCLVALFSFCPSLLQGQRLPGGVHPTHYALHLTPDLQKASFGGVETIDVVLDAPSRTITLNAAEIRFGEVRARSNEGVGKSASAWQAATVASDEKKEQATFSFSQPLPAGKVELAIEYSGVLNDKLRGFYLSKTRSRNYAVTQFEPTDARRAFPSFDEPALKATFDISLTVDAHDSVISNTNILDDIAAQGGKHTIRFATTPRMSSYLVAFLVGDFKCVSSSSDGVPIRACATPDKVELARFAVDSAKYVLHYYNTYFGIRYPMPKLDMVALPDFEAGAMENFGCITYRETDLLLDPRTAAVSDRKRVASVVAHEMAHQWFGDMVTMQWWDNLWLNEGFATWMAYKPVAKWHPEWGIAQDAAQDLNRTLDSDSRATTRTIRAKAETPDEINEMFDGIAYGKAGAVLGMVENYLGEETFRQGVHNYLQAHLYANATAEDFWNAQTANSHLPVDKIMGSFVEQPGVPLLSFGEVASGKSVVTQQRFFLSPRSSTPSHASWIVPVCVKSGTRSACHLVSAQDSSLPIGGTASSFLYANAGNKGYFRSSYTPSQIAAIEKNAESGLTPPERIGLLGDQWALTRSAKRSVGDLLNLILSLKRDSDATLIEYALDRIDDVDAQIAIDHDHAELMAVLRNQFLPVYAALGRPAKDESMDRQRIRGRLFELLGRAKDPGVLAESRTLAQSVYNPAGPDHTSLPPSLAEAAVSVAATQNDATLYEAVLTASRNPSDPVKQADALRALTKFTEPSLVKRTLDYAASGEVRNQDSWIVFSELLRQSATRDLAWAYIKQNWKQVHAQFTTNSGSRVVAAAHNFCSVPQREDVAKFFATHKVAASERTLAQTLNSIDDCVQLRSTQEPELRRWLSARR